MHIWDVGSLLNLSQIALHIIQFVIMANFYAAYVINQVQIQIIS